MKNIAQSISWILMPILMPIYALIIVFYTESQEDYIFNENNFWNLPNEVKSSLIQLFFVFCVIAPGISFLLLKNRKIISSIEMDEKNERYLPIFIMGLYCAALFYLLYIKTEGSILPKLIYLLPLSGAIISFFSLFLNRFIKVSLHATGAGILVGFIIAYFSFQEYFNFYIIPLCIFLSGLVLSSRYFLEKHSFKELGLGWVSGCFITFLCCKFPNIILFFL